MKILVVDDQRSARRALRDMLETLADVEIHEAGTAAEAFTLCDELGPDLLLLDVRLSAGTLDRGGLDLLHRLREAGDSTPTVMVTSLTELADVRDAMRLGAQDYVFKDELSPELLLPIVAGFRERSLLRRDVLQLRRKVERQYGLDAILGSSPAMERVRRRVTRLADAQVSILIRGETGSGKELVARALHEVSARRDEPFVAVNCAALPGNLIESLIFGHERGAFTGADRRARGQMELAGAGTLLLDEIAELPVDLQAKLLRVLEEKSFRPVGAERTVPLLARVVAATHQDLEARISDGRFRQDLYFRMNVVTIDVPSLAERAEDIPALLASFTEQAPRRIRFSAEAVDWLLRQSWPGNVRELRNVVERLSLLAESDLIDLATVEELARDRPRAKGGGELAAIARAILALPSETGDKLAAVTAVTLARALEASRGNKSEAARLVGLHRKALDRRLERRSDGGDG